MIVTSILLAAAATRSTSAQAFVSQKLYVTSYKTAKADLNGDGRPELFIYATDQDNCGSGGCDLYVLMPQSGTYRVVMHSSVTQLPVRLLATKSHGWRDIGVTVVGGGIVQSYMARMRFNGRSYPENPTVPPAIPMRRPSGKLLINR